jgi:hypothetical protein
VELAWVLTSAYRLDAVSTSGIRNAAIEEIAIERASWAARLSGASADFADCLITRSAARPGVTGR